MYLSPVIDWWPVQGVFWAFNLSVLVNGSQRRYWNILYTEKQNGITELKCCRIEVKCSVNKKCTYAVTFHHWTSINATITQQAVTASLLKKLLRLFPEIHTSWIPPHGRCLVFMWMKVKTNRGGVFGQSRFVSAAQQPPSSLCENKKNPFNGSFHLIVMQPSVCFSHSASHVLST